MALVLLVTTVTTASGSRGTEREEGRSSRFRSWRDLSPRQGYELKASAGQS